MPATFLHFLSFCHRKLKATRNMELTGRNGRMCCNLFFILSVLSLASSAPMEPTGDCFEPCKDIANEEEKEQCLLKNCPDFDIKRSVGGFVRIGKSDIDDNNMESYETENKRRLGDFVRTGKGNPGSFVRIGRANRHAFVRIGKAFPRYFMRMIKGNPSSFVRIGRGNPGSFVRIGKSLEDGDTDTDPVEENKRMGGFVRIGKGNPGSFVRIGKGNPASFVRIGKGNPGSFVRIGKGNPSNFVRIGKSLELEEDSALDGQDSQPVMEARNDQSRFLRLG